MGATVTQDSERQRMTSTAITVYFVAIALVSLASVLVLRTPSTTEGA